MKRVLTMSGSHGQALSSALRRRSRPDVLLELLPTRTVSRRCCSGDAAAAAAAVLGEQASSSTVIGVQKPQVRNSHSDAFGRGVVVRSFSTATTENNPASANRTGQQTNHRAGDLVSLGLASCISEETMQSIQSLPEVKEALTSSNSSSSSSSSQQRSEALERAADIFQSILPWGKEHVAIVLLLVEEWNTTMTRYTDCLKRLLELEDHYKNPNDIETRRAMSLARQKMAWFHGEDPLTELAVHNAAADSDNDDDNNMASMCASNGLGLSLLLKKHSEWTSEEKEVILKQLHHSKELALQNVGENNDSWRMAFAASCSNLGVAQHLLGDFQEAIVTMNEGLDAIVTENDNSDHYKAEMVTARLHCNLAWIYLFHGDVVEGKKTTETDLKDASHHARTALELETITPTNNAGSSSSMQVAAQQQQAMRRALGLVAECYARAGSAVTAEGLFQSAVERVLPGLNERAPPHAIIDARNVHMAYSQLCDNWDKRQGDAAVHKQTAKALENELGLYWKSQSGLVSGLWFYTKSDF
eukprot:scaffold24444_cov48-Attheya_sp.AAC.1